jgi:signal transduction histidine kinase
MAQAEFPVYVVRVEPDGGFIVEDANETVAKLGGRPAGTIIGLAPREYLPREDADFLEARLRGCVLTRRPISFERSWNSEEGRVPWKTTMLPVVDRHGAVTHVVGIARDVPVQNHDERRDFAERLLATRIDERRRIAEDLHDSTAQHLTAVGLALARISVSSGSSSAGVRRAETLAGLEDARSSLDEAHREIRMLSYLLHPPLLESKGLGEAIRIFATGFASRASLALEIHIDRGADQIPEDAALSLFRVCQEALTNVHRHAKASRVVVRLEIDESIIILKVEDDGSGFKEPRLATERPAGVGLAGMRERMTRLGGYVQLKRGGIGTRLVAVIPRPGQQEELLL